MAGIEMNIPKRSQPDAPAPHWYRETIDPELRAEAPAIYAGYQATLVCPKGHACWLRIHHIAADGSVSPSAVCPIAGCGFHDFIKLLDWDPPLPPTPIKTPEDLQRITTR